MDKLKLFLKALNKSDRVKFAQDCGTSLRYIRKVMYSDGKIFFGTVIARKMEIHSNGIISRKYLRPHDWQEHWPELAEQQDSEVV